eukprot:1506635-Prymnesium_polylepis.1
MWFLLVCLWTVSTAPTALICDADANASASIATLGLLLPLSEMAGRHSASFVQATACAALLAVRHADTKNATIVPALGRLEPGFRMRGLLFDTMWIERG